MFDAIPRGDKQFLLPEKAEHQGALRTEDASAAHCNFVRNQSSASLNHTSLHTSAGSTVS
jgi:hypothetical protein